MLGYARKGYTGCAVGVICGTVLGAVGGAVVMVGGACRCIYQVAFGLLRTPKALLAYSTGQDWDADIEEFVTYDLKSDASKTLRLGLVGLGLVGLG
jgi:hypothetical protein